jgi:hypothetical protein
MMQDKVTTFTSKYDGTIAVWPLHSPSLPLHGGWCWIKIVDKRIVFVRSLTESEINSICLRYMVWGVKYVNEPWAIVCGEAGGSGRSISRPADSSRSIGV